MVKKIISLEDHLKARKQMEQLPRVIQELQARVASEPEEAEHYLLLGAAYWERGEREITLQTFREALKIAKDSRDVLTALAVALLETENYIEALQMTERLIILVPDKIDAYLLKANILVALDEIVEARDAIEDAIKRGPKDPKAIVRAAILLNEVGDHRTAHVLLHPLEKEGKLNPEGLEAFGRSLVELGQDKKAVRILKQAVRLHPGSSQAYGNLGMAYASLGQNEQAIGAWRYALNLDPNDQIVRINLGIALSMQGDYATAASILRETIDEVNYWEPLWIHYGTSLLNIGEYHEALKIFDKVNILVVDKATKYEALNLTGLCKIFLGQTDSASQVLEQAIELDPNLAEAYYNYGLLFAREGKLHEAIETYKKALERDPEARSRDAAIKTLKQLLLSGGDVAVIRHVLEWLNLH